MKYLFQYIHYFFFFFFFFFFFILFLIGIATTAFYSLELTIDKYLIFSKYINSYEILSFQGIIELILGVLSLIITTKYNFIDNFWDYYNKLDENEVIILILLILSNFINYSLIIIIIDILSPFYIILIFLISLLIIFLFRQDFSPLSIIFILLIFFYSFVTLIFTEIIELNCFGLSYMTKRNIELRAHLDSIIEEGDKERNDSEIGLQGYIVELNDDMQEEKLLPNDIESSKEGE